MRNARKQFFSKRRRRHSWESDAVKSPRHEFYDGYGRGAEKHLLFAVLEAILVILVTEGRASTEEATAEQRRREAEKLDGEED